MSKIRNRMTGKGVIAVEFVGSLGVFLMMILFLIAYCRFISAKQKALSLARFGTALQSCGLLDEDVIEDAVVRWRQELEFSFPFKFSVDRGRFLDIPGASFYKLMSTRVSCEINLPVLMRSLGSGFRINEIVVEEKAEVEI